MMIRPRLFLPLIAVVATVLLAGCSWGDSEEEDKYNASIGSNERTPQTDALGVAEPQALVGAEVNSERGPVAATVVDDQVALPPGEPVELARQAAVSVSADDFPVGLFVELTLDIRGAGPIEMLVPVEAQEGPYAEIEVTEPPDGDVSPS